MTPRSRRRIPWWSRLYLAMPRSAVAGFARLYARTKTLLGGPARVRRQRERLQPYADLVDWPVEQLAARRSIEYTLEQFDLFFVFKPAFPRLPRFRIDHPEYLTDALARGHGAIVGMEHIAFRRMILPAVQSLGVRPRFIVPPTKRRPTPKTLRKKLRAGLLDRVDRSGNYRSTRQVRDAFRLLASGGVAVIATDGRGGEMIPLPFLGTTVYRPTGPARISHRTGAPIIVALPRVEPDGELVLELQPPIYPPADLPEREAVAEIMRRVIAVVEPFIRTRPWTQSSHFVRQAFEKAKGRIPAIGVPDAIADSGIGEGGRIVAR